VMGYYNNINDLIGLSESGTYTNFNADTVGLELALEGKWLDKITTRLSYSLQRTENRATDVGLPDSPENMIKLNINAPLYKDKIFAGLEVQYTSQSKTVIDTFPVIVPGPNSPGYTVVNLTLFSQDLFTKNLQLSASIYNLLDAKYYEPASDFHLQPYIQQNGINFRIKATYSF
jgi:outer membrane receptor for ferrienterochelin and colicins